MAIEVRDLDGQSTLEIDSREGSVFLSGYGFTYEFDRGIILNALRREFGLTSGHRLADWALSRADREFMEIAPTVPIPIIRPDAAVA